MSNGGGTAFERLSSIRARISELRKRIAEGGPENFKEDIELLNELEQAVQSTAGQLANRKKGI